MDDEEKLRKILTQPTPADDARVLAEHVVTIYRSAFLDIPEELREIIQRNHKEPLK